MKHRLLLHIALVAIEYEFRRKHYRNREIIDEALNWNTMISFFSRIMKLILSMRDDIAQRQLYIQYC